MEGRAQCGGGSGKHISQGNRTCLGRKTPPQIRLQDSLSTISLSLGGVDWRRTHTSRALFFSFWGLNMFTTKCVVMESNSASINNDVFTGERKKIRKNPASRRREESLTFCEFVFGGGGVNGSSTWEVCSYKLLIFIYLLNVWYSLLEGVSHLVIYTEISWWSCLDLSKMEGKAKEKWTRNPKIKKSTQTFGVNVRERKEGSIGCF